MTNETQSAKGYGPASMGNFSVAFDVIGVGLTNPGDTVTAVKTSKKKDVEIICISGDGGKLSKDPNKNTAGVTAAGLLEAVDADFGVTLSVEKGIPLGSGLGSSAASATAALVAVNALLKDPLKKNDLIPFAIEAEFAACGARHADNVAPSLLGGVVMITSYEPLRVYKLPIESSLWVATVTPEIEVNTKDARAALPANIPLSIASTQLGLFGGALHGLLQDDELIIEQHLVDLLVEPYRKQFIPEFDTHKEAALDAGALAFGISGAGPTVFALCKDEKVALSCSEKIKYSFQEISIESTPYTLSLIHI